MSSAGRTIGEFAARFSKRTLTKAQHHLACRALLDTYAAAIAGAKEDATRLAQRHAARSFAAGPASVWTNGANLSPEGAAWTNAIAGHVLDFDDVMTHMRAHVSVTLVPALTALGQAHGATIGDFALAYVCGIEVMAKFARAMALPHYTKGWHSTSSQGILGTTVACGALLRLNPEQIGDALGLAVAQAAGSRANFGFMAKSFQAGQCAGAAVRAAELAAMGFTASHQAIDGPSGYMALYADNQDLTGALAGLGDDPLEIETTGIDVKKYPCCYAIHRALDGIFALMREHGVTADNLATLDVLTSAGGLQPLIKGIPQSGLEAKFSLEWSLAAALADGRIGLSSYGDEAARRPDIRALMAKISVGESEGTILPRWSELNLRLGDGRAFTRRVQVARGDAGDPLSDSELIAKAQDCFTYGGKGDVKAFAAALFGDGNRTLSSLFQDLG